MMAGECKSHHCCGRCAERQFYMTDGQPIDGESTAGSNDTRPSIRARQREVFAEWRSAMSDRDDRRVAGPVRRAHELRAADVALGLGLEVIDARVPPVLSGMKPAESPS